MNTASGPAPPMTDYAKLVGPPSEWISEPRQGGISRNKREVAKSLPAPRHGQTPDGLSWLAHRGAAELLGCPAKEYHPQDLRTCIETTFDYWHGKMYTIRAEPYVTAQLFQDELEFNISNIPPEPNAHLPPTDSSFRHTNAVLRPLTTNFTLYTYAIEIKDAYDRLDALDPAVRRAGGEDVQKEMEWIRKVAEMMVEETKSTLRLFWAGGPGKELVRLSLARPWQESTNIVNDIKLHLVQPLREIEGKHPFEAAFAALCLTPEERDVSYGPTEFTQLLALEQASMEDPELQSKYPYALQMALGEWTMAYELLSELPPRPLRIPEPQRPKTIAVRLNVSRSAAMQICTAQPFVASLCTKSTAVEQSAQLWESVKEIQGVFAAEFGLPAELREKLFPFLEDAQETARWEPRDEWGVPLPNDNVSEGTNGKRKRPEFVVDKRDFKLWKKMMEHDGQASVSPPELYRMYRAIGFIVENIGGSFMRFSPAKNAGVPWIMRIPVEGTWTGPGPFRVPLQGVGYNMMISYGWSSDWFGKAQSSHDSDTE